MSRWILPLCLLLSFGLLQANTSSRQLSHIDWEPQHFHSQEKSPHHSLKVRFMANPSPSGKWQRTSEPAHHPLELTAHITAHITAAPRQRFVACAENVELNTASPDTVIYSTPEQKNVTEILLGEHAPAPAPALTLTLMKPIPCPDSVRNQHPYHVGHYLLSDQPSLAILSESGRRKRDTNTEENSEDAYFFPYSPSTDVPPTIEIGSGSMGLPPDEDQFGKRRYGFPGNGAGSLPVMLLPLLELPANWRDMMPDSLSGLLLWGSPDENTGLTLNLLFQGFSNHEHPQQIQISPAELPDFAHYLTDVRQLLYWLAPKLNGRESLVSELLHLLSSMTEAGNLLDEETRQRIEQQLAIILEQPDREFSLTFELHQLNQALADTVDPSSAILTAHNGKKKKDGSGQSTDSTSASQGATGGRHQDQGNPGPGQHQPPEKQEGHQPPQAPAPGTQQPNFELAAQAYQLKAGDILFSLSKNADLTDSEKLHNIKVTRNADGKVIKLIDIEKDSGLPPASRLGGAGDGLDYLLRYGTLDTLREYHRYNNEDWDIPKQELQSASKAVLAALNDRTHIVTLLMNTGEKAPLQYAVQQELSSCVQHLLKRGHVVNTFFEDDMTPLHIAVANNNEPMVKLLLHYQANPNSPCASDGITPFHLAIGQAQLAIARHLKQAGADLDIAAANGDMPWAMIPEETKESLRIELQLLTRVNNPDASEQFLVFIKAIEAGDLAAVKGYMAQGPDLLKEGQQQSAFREQGRFPLHMAVESGNPDMVYALVKMRNEYKGPVEQHSSFYEIVNGVRKTDMCAPLHVAVIKYDEVLQALKDADAVVRVAKKAARENSSDKLLTEKYVKAEEKKELLSKKAKGYLTIIDTLLEHSANPNVQRQSDGATPLYLASERGLLKVVQKLTFKKGASGQPGTQVNQPRRLDKATPLHVAAQGGHAEIVGHLLASLSDPNKNR